MHERVFGIKIEICYFAGVAACMVHVATARNES